MVKKSKQFENLNTRKNSNSKDVILNEFLKNINSYIDYLKKEFPFFWDNYYLPYFCKKITIANLNLQDTQKTIEVLKILFEEYEIINEKFDEDFLKKTNIKTKNLILFCTAKIQKINVKSKNSQDICELFNHLVRSERVNKKYLEYLAPAGFSHFEKIKHNIQSFVLDDNYLKLGKLNCNTNDLLQKKKKYLTELGVESINTCLFYSEFESFCKKFIHAKGLKSKVENFKIVYQGNNYESNIDTIQTFFYKSFLTYLALEQLLIAASSFGKEIFGGPKNKFTKYGSSVSRYQSCFLDYKLSNKLRNIPLFKNMQYQDFFYFRDEYNKKLYFAFMNGESDSLLIPLIILRYFFVNGQALVNDLPNKNNFIVSEAEEVLFFEMNALILNWCSSKFNKCMYFYK